MSAASAVAAIREKLESFGQEVEKELQEHLPEVESAVTAAEGNPVVKALADAANLPEIPEVLGALASIVQVLDAAVGAVKSAAPSAPDAPASAPVQVAPADAAPQQPPAVPASGPAAG